MKPRWSHVALAAIASVLASCDGPEPTRIPAVTEDRRLGFDQAFPELLEEHGVITAGVGIIRGGELEWAGYYGDQSPGVPASEFTQFNVASLTKTVTAEAVLRLAAAGRLDLDEPMGRYWLDPDIADDPRAMQITPRMALTHSTGFPNWRYLSDTDGSYAGDLPLRFRFEPGGSYGYSGEGFAYLSRFIEAKLNVDFEEVVEEYVLRPSGMEHASLSRRAANFSNIVRAEDADGVFHGHYCTPWGECQEEGDWSAAGGLRVTVPDFALFLNAVLSGDGYDASLRDERGQVHVEQWNVPRSILIRCEHLPAEQCPRTQGYGLGWQVADYADYEILSHRGSDWAEAALTYVYADSRDGLIIFLNAPNERAMAMMPEAIELLHPGSPITPHYRYK